MYSNNWLNYYKSEDEYFTCRYELMQDEEALVDDLKLALQSASNRLTALRLLAEVTPKFTVVAPLLPLLVDTAVDNSQLTEIGLAKEILYNNRNESQARITIVAMADNYLLSNDEWHYRRFTELYKLLDYKPELDSLLLRCKENTHPEIRGISGYADNIG